VRLARLGMARSFQLVNIFPELSVGETIAVAAISHLRHGERFFSSTARNRPVWEIVERVGAIFGFSGKLDQPAKILSQGDKKLLDVASAFALSPEIILLDEPTSGVSTADKSTIMRVLVQAARQMGIKAIIQIEHDMDIVFGYSNRIIAVHNGRILADGSPASIRARADVMATIVGRQRDHA
jgi:branched-chain amino acid transport system ATP-binding protein